MGPGVSGRGMEEYCPTSTTVDYSLDLKGWWNDAIHLKCLSLGSDISVK